MLLAIQTTSGLAGLVVTDGSGSSRTKTSLHYRRRSIEIAFLLFFYWAVVACLLLIVAVLIIVVTTMVMIVLFVLL